MKTYLLKRLLSAIPVLFIVSTIVFLILQMTPGDPALVILGQEATLEEVEDLRQQLKLDRPIYEQYFNWLFNALQGDLGESYFMNDSVMEAIISHLGPTISLGILAEIIAITLQFRLVFLRRGARAL